MSACDRWLCAPSAARRAFSSPRRREAHSATLCRAAGLGALTFENLFKSISFEYAYSATLALPNFSGNELKAKRQRSETQQWEANIACYKMSLQAWREVVDPRLANHTKNLWSRATYDRPAGRRRAGASPLWRIAAVHTELAG